MSNALANDDIIGQLEPNKLLNITCIN